MSELRSRHPKATLVAGMLLLAMALWAAAASWPARSQAYTVSVYCDGAVLAPYTPCEGAERNLYAVEGWGEWAVCVFIEANTEYGRECTTAGEHIYDPVPNGQSRPGITNFTSNHTQTVHGRAYQP